MTPDQQQAIQQDAERAAQERQTPNEKCPHPFSSEQGRHWVKCYWAERDRRYDDEYRLVGTDFEDHHEERRGK